ncbi:MAG: hypothetical protein LBB26_03070 [Puniceicoccales bacterium]|jgi:hypothetical protein|nr:hypothetical protein [Puniceicoccales bacterium]
MKSNTDTTAHASNIFDGDWELQMLPIPGLTPGFTLELLFLWEFPASLGRASPLSVAKAI